MVHGVNGRSSERREEIISRIIEQRFLRSEKLREQRPLKNEEKKKSKKKVKKK